MSGEGSGATGSGVSAGTGIGVTVGVGTGTAARAGGVATARGNDTVGVRAGGGLAAGVGVGRVLTTGGGAAGRLTVEPGRGVRLKFSRPGISIGVGVGAGAGTPWALTGAAVPNAASNGSVNARQWRADRLNIIPTPAALAPRS